MNSNQETFIFKEFIVGLIVIVIFLLIFLTGLGKVTKSTFYKNLLSQKKEVVKEEPDYCQNYPFLQISKNSKSEFKRTVKRSGWQDKNYAFTITYPEVSKNKVSFDISSEKNEVPKETIDLICNENGIEIKDYDKTLISQLLNTYPEKLDDFATYKLNEDWLSGSLGETEKHCFSLTVKSKLVYAGQDEENYKIEKMWEATSSAYMKETKTPAECENFRGDFDASAFVSFKEELWYASGSGLVKRKITPESISGQVSFLPNGYLPLEITDEIVIK